MQKDWELVTLKAFARGLGVEPEKVLTETAFAKPHRAYATSEDREEAQARIISIAIKERIKKEPIDSKDLPSLTNSPR